MDSRCSAIGRLGGSWLVLIAALCNAMLIATEPDAPAVSGTTGASDDADSRVTGCVLLGTLTCTACHALPDDSAWIARSAAPRLEVLASRMNPAWLQSFLTDPHATMPGTTMPDVLGGIPAGERAQTAIELTQFLIARRPGLWTTTLPDRAAVARGADLYQHIGCVACHAPVDQPGFAGVPLPRMADKWTVSALRDFLRDPLASRPDGRMPSLGLSEREAGDVAEYLLQETRVEAPLLVAEYRGRMDDFDEIETADLVRTASATDFTSAVDGVEPRHAVHVSGWFHVEQEVDRTVMLSAQGACRIGVDGRWVIGSDTWRRDAVEGSATVHLKPGWHALMMEYTPRGQAPGTVAVSWDGPQGQRSPIPSSLLHSDPQPALRPPDLIPDAAAAERGHGRYQQLGCARCHEDHPAPMRSSAPALLSLRTGRGCLADEPDQDVPGYHLDQHQRHALRMAIDQIRSAGTAPPSPHDQLTLGLAAFRCTACHVRDGQGGVTPERSPYMLSQSDDSGDEGRLPPHLDGVGDRVSPTWLMRVLTGDARVRPYVRTRMPHFGAANVGPLATLFVTLDRQPQQFPSVSDQPEVLRAAGRTLAGTNGLSCIACHRFNRQPGLNWNMMDLTLVPERLNEDWFRRFLRDPNRFHPGTRMPSFWPAGMSLIASVLGGDTERQLRALWTYFADGQQAIFPDGLSRTNREIVVGGQPVVYRGKLWEAGFRAVAMGFPGQVSAAFDAEEMRLALLWRGRFLDVGPHWSQAGMGLIHPLGDQVVVSPHGSAWAVLTDLGSPWPHEPGKDLGMTFHGYALDGHLTPTLHYAFRTLAIADRFTAADCSGTSVLERQLLVTGAPVGHLYLRLAVGALAATGPGSWRLDDALTITVTSGGPAIVRGGSGHQDLLVPMAPSPVDDAAATRSVEIRYAW